MFCCAARNRLVCRQRNRPILPLMTSGKLGKKALKEARQAIKTLIASTKPPSEQVCNCFRHRSGLQNPVKLSLCRTTYRFMDNAVAFVLFHFILFRFVFCLICLFWFLFFSFCAAPFLYCLQSGCLNWPYWLATSDTVTGDRDDTVVVVR